MASVLTHPAVALGLAPHFREPPFGPRVWALGALCTVVPDLDALGFWAGVPYDSLFGHRGLTHSIAFALVLAGALCLALRRRDEGISWAVFVYLALCGMSHGFYDALTTGGLGVAFFAPFSSERFFLPWRVIVVSPISITGFFTERAFRVLASELRWIVLPWLAVGLIGLWRGRAARGRV